MFVFEKGSIAEEYLETHTLATLLIQQVPTLGTRKMAMTEYLRELGFSAAYTLSQRGYDVSPVAHLRSGVKGG